MLIICLSLFFRRSRYSFAFHPLTLRTLFYGNANHLIAIMFPDWPNTANWVAFEKNCIEKLKLRSKKNNRKFGIACHVLFSWKKCKYLEKEQNFTASAVFFFTDSTCLWWQWSKDLWNTSYYNYFIYCSYWNLIIGSCSNYQIWSPIILVRRALYIMVEASPCDFIYALLNKWNSL